MFLLDADMSKSIAVTQLRGKKGFTLVELMIVIAIIGILAAIAIPQFSAYKKRASDQRALAQVKDMAAAEESYFAENGRYTTSLADLQNYGFIADANVTRTRSLVGTNAYVLTATHTSGTGKIFTWNSGSGGLQE